MNTYELPHHRRAATLSRKHQDDYYVMRDHCRLDWEPDAYYVLSGTQFDSSLAEEESCTIVAVYIAGNRTE